MTIMSYQSEILSEYNLIMKKFEKIKGKERTKISGHIAANLFKKYIEKVFIDNGLKYKVSPINSYISGCAVEWDALILKENAQDVTGFNIYAPSDIITVLEFKARGIFFKKDTGDIGTGTGKALKKFFDSYEELKSGNLKDGYITMSEQNPASGIYFADSNKKFEGLAFCLAENSSAGNLYDNGCTWDEFVLKLVP